MQTEHAAICAASRATEIVGFGITFALAFLVGDFLGGPAAGLVGAGLAGLLPIRFVVVPGVLLVLPFVWIWLAISRF